jgi:SRSO17 transposase
MMPMDSIKEIRPFLPISVVKNNTYGKDDRMITIGKIPEKVKSFFRPLNEQFTKPSWRYFWEFVLTMAAGNAHTIDRLIRLLRGTTHRTCHGEFLWQSPWDGPTVLQQIALDTLKRMRLRKGERIYLILDDTQTLKRAKKMDGVGKLFHHATGRYGTGHTILKACLYVRGVTIPWASCLWLKKPDAKKLKVPFAKLTELAAGVIRNAGLPERAKVTVLFDAYYLCPNVVRACEERSWHWIGVGKSNRNFTVNVRSCKLGKLGNSALRRGQWGFVKGLSTMRVYRLASRIGRLRGIGDVKVVFSRRRGEKKHMALVTDDRSRSTKRIVGDYLLRWAIELLIKEEKQHLGLGAYRVLRYRAVVSHLHLVDAAYACLTHLGLKDLGAQGRKKNCVLRLPPISQLKARMQQVVWQEAVQDVIRYSHEKPVLRRLGKLLAA